MTLADLAQQIATEAHTGQVDKSGAPYIGHPARVAARLSDEKEVAVAWLHDVLEDTHVTSADLQTRGIPDDVVGAVEALTRHDGQGDDYYRIVRANPIALAVKLADVADNMDLNRRKLLDEATASRLAVKYAHALELLNGLPPREAP